MEQPSEVRRRILDEHAALAREMERVRKLGEGGDLATFTGAARALFERVLTHMAMEERVLAPALERTDAWGRERAARLRSDHHAQRAWIKASAEKLCGRTSIAEARADVLAILSKLDADMKEEEARDLDPDLLSDSIPPPDLGGGID